MTAIHQFSERFRAFRRPFRGSRATLGAPRPGSCNELKPMNASVSSVRGTRRSIVIPLALLMGAVAIIGFWRTYFGALFAGRSEAEGMIHLHAAIFMGWIALVIAQSYFAITGRIALHIRFGKIGMAYGVALVVFGLGFSLIKFARRVAEVGVDG